MRFGDRLVYFDHSVYTCLRLKRWTTIYEYNVPIHNTFVLNFDVWTRVQNWSRKHLIKKKKKTWALSLSKIIILLFAQKTNTRQNEHCNFCPPRLHIKKKKKYKITIVKRYETTRNDTNRVQITNLQWVAVNRYLYVFSFRNHRVKRYGVRNLSK